MQSSAAAVNVSAGIVRASWRGATAVQVVARLAVG